MKIFIDVSPGDPPPKRGDLLHTNIGKSRERTLLVIRSRRAKLRLHRWNVWAERWWDLEPDLRMRLFRSAERAGGQEIMYLVRYPAKKRRGKIPVELRDW